MENFVCSYCGQEYLALCGNVYPKTESGFSVIPIDYELVGEDDLEKTEELDIREIGKYPNDADACIDLAHRMWGNEKIAAYKHAIKIAPNRAEINLFLGETLLEQGRLEEAEDAFFQAIKKKNEFAWAYHCLGKVLHQQGRLAEAEAAFRQGLRQFPNMWETYIDLGLLLDTQGRVNQAEEVYRLSIMIKPNPAAFAYLALVCLDNGRMSEAQEAYSNAVKIDERYANKNFFNGLQIQRKGFMKEAENAFRQASEEDAA